MSVNTYDTFLVGAAFEKSFLVKSFDLNILGTNDQWKASWKFQFYNGRVPDTAELEAEQNRGEIIQQDKDVLIIFKVPSSFFKSDMVGDCKYQVRLYGDPNDQNNNYPTLSFLAEIKEPI